MRKHIFLISEQKDIFVTLNLFDDLFEPALSLRIADLDKYAKKLEDNANVYVIEDNGTSGFIAFYSNDFESRTAYLILLGVTKKAQGKGLAKELLDVCVELSKKKGMLNIKLEVRKKNNKAIRFYERNEFRFCEVASSESIYMIRDL